MIDLREIPFVIIKLAHWFVRLLFGGLWVQYDTGEWFQCEWSNKEDGYILNPQTGGIFHKTYNGINKIEDRGEKR